MVLSYYLPFFYLLFFSFPITSVFGVRNNETDKLALLEFKSKITNDPFGVLTSWNASLHFCQWYGISCDPQQHQRVTILRLESLQLSGTISPSITNLTFLRELNLQNNNFDHEIPLEIGHLFRLQYLLLNINSITGRIPPSISNCSQLVMCNLNRNSLVGEIPAEFGSLVKLKVLSLRNNNLIGNIPPSLGNMSSLEGFYAYYNYLDGALPDTLGNLLNLRNLSLSMNLFSGKFPLIFNLSLIELIDFTGNSLNGSVPMDLDIYFPNLNFFSIANNQFTGTIPNSVFNATNLQILQLSNNSFTGPVPSCSKLHRLESFVIAFNFLGGGETNDLGFLSTLTNATNLNGIYIGSNNFGGQLPRQISNFSKTLEMFVIEQNQISGSIDAGVDALINLRAFSAGVNKLSGLIPSSFGNLQNLMTLYLGFNHFTGLIPSSLGNLTNITKIDLANNALVGVIPSSLATCKNLLHLDLSDNNLSGLLPPQIFELTSLSIALDLSHNRFSGSLPTEVGNLQLLGFLGLYNNMFSGEIPASLGSCRSLEMLYLDSNFFQGSIPSSIGSLRSLRKLRLAHNNLSGEIPEFLKDFQLEELDISNNDFEGIVPIEGIFKNSSSVNLVGNANLCGGIPDFELPACKFQKSKIRLTRKLKIIISLASVLTCAAFVLIYLLIRLHFRKRKGEVAGWDGNPLLNLSYGSLLEATNGFSTDNLIGAGSFGTVYKGNLVQEGIVIAVKVINLMRSGASKSFIAECEALKNICHRNLVKVLTACSSIDYSGKDFKALVYEFMVNGSLDDWLHPTFVENQVPRTLNFLQRLNIAIDVASALEYLHHHSEPPIAHCDLKPSNILLDEEMTAHVSDFGLAKFLSSEIVEASTTESSSIGIRGTIGYCPPEYGIGSEVTTVGDIFSFGIILLELFTGKRPTDEMSIDDRSLHGFVKRALPENVMDIADPQIFQMELSEDAASNSSFSNIERNNILKESLISIFEIGMSCATESSQYRMVISDAVAQLSSIRNKLQHARPSQEQQVLSAHPSAGAPGRP